MQAHAAAGLTLLNNLAQLVTALSGKPRAVPVLLSFFGVSNCAGEAWGHALWQSTGTCAAAPQLTPPLYSWLDAMAQWAGAPLLCSFSAVPAAAAPLTPPSPLPSRPPPARYPA